VYCGVGAIMIDARATILVCAAAVAILCGGSATILLVGARAFWERDYASSVGLDPQGDGYSIATAYR